MKLNWEQVKANSFYKPHVMVWPFEDAPKFYKDLSEHGGDEDYIAVVPADLRLDGYVRWLEDGCFANDVQVVKLDNGDTVYIGAHA